MFAFGKVIFFVIVLAVIVWYLSSFLFGWLGTKAKKRVKKLHDDFTTPDEATNKTKEEVNE